MSNINLFENQKVRSEWNQKEQKWYFSIVDVIAVLTESPNARKYWSVLKTRLKQEGSELTTNCSQLKMQSADGKFYLTDVAIPPHFYASSNPFPPQKQNHLKCGLLK